MSTIEAVITVLLSTRSPGRCKLCRMPIVWYRSIAGTSMPFTAAPMVDRLRRDARAVDSPVIGDIARRDLHWRTCPGMKATRRRVQ